MAWMHLDMLCTRRPVPRDKHIHLLRALGSALQTRKNQNERNSQVLQQQHLEGHVLKEVRSAVVLLGLVAAAGVNPNTNSGSVAVAPLKRE